MRARGQAITEFAMVFPIFILCVFTFIFLSIWSYNTNAASNVAREAARAGSLQASKSSQYFATHPITSVIFARDICDPYGNDTGSDAPVGNWIGNTLTRPSGATYTSTEVVSFRLRNTLIGCTAGREVRPGSPVGPRYLYAERVSGRLPYDRIGWDWGLLAENGGGQYARQPLTAAIDRAQALIGQRVLGGGAGAQISACYRLTLADGQLSDCVMTMRSGSSVVVLSGALAAANALIAAPAPSAISVFISLPTIGIAFLPPYIERGGATLLIDRFGATCRAPLVAADAFPGSCGSLY
jgi:hypothetical protein